MTKYSVMIIGDKVNKPEEINLSFQMLYYGLAKNLKRLDHVKVIEKDINKDLNDLPEVDFTIGILYSHFWNEEVLNKLRPKCKKIVSFLETPQPKADISFGFRHRARRNNRRKDPKDTTIITAPYDSDLLKYTEKEPNTVLLDHFWLNWIKQKQYRWEWSQKIYKALEPYKNKYDFYALTKFCNVEYRGHDKKYKNWVDIQEDMMPDYITPIHTTNYIDYLEKTKHYETFIVTHSGSYNFSVVDMIARGARIITPSEFVPNYNVRELDLLKAYNIKELVNFLNQPVNRIFWKEKRESCTPMRKVAKIIDNKFKELL